MNNTKNKKVSVVIATYKRGELLSSCLRSLKKSKFSETCSFEVVVVDDGGGLSETLIKEHSDLSVKWESLNANQGQPAAQARGVELSTGDYYAFIDDDAEADEGWVESVHNYFCKNPDVGAILGRVEPFSTKKLLQRTRQQIYDKRHNTYLNPDYVSSLKLKYSLEISTKTGLSNHVSGGNFAIRKEIFDEIGGFVPNIRLGSDDLISSRLLEAGIPIGYNPEMVIYHHHNESYKVLFKNNIHEGRDRVRRKRMDGVRISTLLRNAIFDFITAPFRVISFPQILKADRFLIRAYFVFTMIQYFDSWGQFIQCLRELSKKEDV